mgnify:CR=1 FL=1
MWRYVHSSLAGSHIWLWTALPTFPPHHILINIFAAHSTYRLCIVGRGTDWYVVEGRLTGDELRISPDVVLGRPKCGCWMLAICRLNVVHMLEV